MLWEVGLRGAGKSGKRSRVRAGAPRAGIQEGGVVRKRRGIGWGRRGGGTRETRGS